MKICRACSNAFTATTWVCPACGHAPRTVAGIPILAADLAFHNERYPNGAFDELAALEEEHFWCRSRSKLIAWALNKYFPGARSFLEVGCGTGFVLRGIERECPKIRVCGGEASLAGLKWAASRLRTVDLLQMDARDLPFIDEFDVIGCFDVLEHIREDVQVLAEIHKALRPGGGLVITVPQHPWLWGPDDDYAKHVRRYTSVELTAKVIAAGFRMTRSSSFVTLLLPLMAASRFIRRHSRKPFDANAEFRIGMALNNTLERVLDGERALIAAGARLPFGGSLLAVAIKPG